MIPVHVVKGAVRQQIIEFRRYAFNTLSAFITMYIVFVMLFFGARAVSAPSALGNTLEGLIVGYMVWALALIGFQEIAWNITNESQQGTLEQIFLSPWGFPWVASGRLIASFLFSAALSAVLLTAMLLTTGQRLQLNLASIVPLLLIAALQAYGLGLMMGGLALMYKRIQAAFQVVTFALVGVIAAPASIPLVFLLPLNKATQLLRSVMVEGVGLFQIPAADLLTGLGVTALWLGLGLAVFARCERVARRQGLLGRY